MTKTADTRNVLVSREDPARYNFPEGPINNAESREQEDRCKQMRQRVDVKVNGVSPQSLEFLRSILPGLIAKMHPTSVEFVHLGHWKFSELSEVRMLRGVILRDAKGTILLYNYGVGVGSSSDPYGHYDLVCEAFGISQESKALIEQFAWPTIDYSVVVKL